MVQNPFHNVYFWRVEVDMGMEAAEPFGCVTLLTGGNK